MLYDVSVTRNKHCGKILLKEVCIDGPYILANSVYESKDDTESMVILFRAPNEKMGFDNSVRLYLYDCYKAAVMFSLSRMIPSIYIILTKLSHKMGFCLLKQSKI